MSARGVWSDPGEYDRLTASSRHVAGCGRRGVEAINEAPIRARFADGRIELDPVVLVGDGTRLELRGALDIAPGGLIAAAASGSFDLSLLRTIAPGLQATGEGNIVLVARGRWSEPDLNGELVLAAERVRFRGVNPADR